MGIVLRNGNLIDGTGKVVKDAVVVIEGAIITAAGKAGEVEIPAGHNRVIDVAGMTIMPGLMDLHVHLHEDASESLGGRPHDRFGEMVDFIEDTDAYLAVFMVQNARKTLEAGFTTVLDGASPRDLSIDIARAQRDGLFIGPRIIASTWIGMTRPAGKMLTHGIVGGDITGPVEAVKVVREKLGSGADWLHLVATGIGPGQFGHSVETLTVEEMRAATDEAHKLGRRVTGSAAGSKGIRNAVIAGVDCIEFGGYLCEDDDLIKMMADRRVGFTPPLMVNITKRQKKLEAEARGEKSSFPEYWLEREVGDYIEAKRRSFEKAMEAGVLVAIGSDTAAPYLEHGKNAVEIEQFVKYGATEMQAIEAATRVPAEILGMDDRLGTVQVGKEADVIVVKGDPLKDIRLLQNNENVALVIKGGKTAVERPQAFVRVS